MNSVNIFEKSWLDLVFDGKNKSYGAYQLRQDSSKTTLLAFLYGLLFIGLISALGLFLSSFREKSDVPKPFDTEVIISVAPSILPKNTKKVVPVIEKKKEAVEKKKIEKKDLQNAVITKKEEADDISTNKETKENPTPTEGSPTGTVSTSLPTFGGSQGGTETTEAPTATGTGTIIPAALDKLPEFPGGINKFYQYVGNNFEKPQLDIETAKVIMSFVIEKDGKMTDIKVLRSPGYGLDTEAVRVLKSLRTKWKPGMKDGQPVRTLYTLPIIVKI